MTWATRKYRVRVRTIVIGEVEVSVHGYDEISRINAAVSNASQKSRRVQIKNARRPITGGEIEVLTVEPVAEVMS